MLPHAQNDRWLTPDHGFPVRIVIPGFIGGRMVKWLCEISVEAQESQNHYHFFDNRVLPSHVDQELANKEGKCCRGWLATGYVMQQHTCPFHIIMACVLPLFRLVVQARLHHQRPEHQLRHRLALAR
jgi:DMSO/TMAO reductase YedYZ molybdopterin-dependent catalytic subunit